MALNDQNKLFFKVFVPLLECMCLIIDKE